MIGTQPQAYVASTWSSELSFQTTLTLETLSLWSNPSIFHTVHVGDILFLFLSSKIYLFKYTDTYIHTQSYDYWWTSLVCFVLCVVFNFNRQDDFTTLLIVLKNNHCPYTVVNVSLSHGVSFLPRVTMASITSIFILVTGWICLLRSHHFSVLFGSGHLHFLLSLSEVFNSCVHLLNTLHRSYFVFRHSASLCLFKLVLLRKNSILFCFLCSWHISPTWCHQHFSHLWIFWLYVPMPVLHKSKNIAA